MGYAAIFKYHTTIPHPDCYINPCCIGGDIISNIFQSELKHTDFFIVQQGQEDWGWYLRLKRETFTYAIDIGLEDQVDDEHFTFKVFFRESPGIFTRWLKKRNQHLLELCQCSQRALKKHGIIEVEWWITDNNSREIERTSV